MVELREDLTSASERVVVIRPRTNWFELDLPQLWQFRDLLFALAWRDIRLRYRQTALGITWVVLQPLLGAIIFTVVFGLIAKMPSEGTPYIVISYSGLLGWTFFSTTLTRVGGCMVANSELIRKIFFPRLLLPLGIIPCTLVDLGFGAIFMTVLLIYFQILPGIELLMLPVAILILAGLALGIGTIAGSLAVKYRDIQYILPLFIQLLMYASPVGYSTKAVPDYMQLYYNLNPLVAPIEVIRFALTGVGQVNMAALAYSAVISIVALTIGLVVFRLTERKFADVI